MMVACFSVKRSCMSSSCRACTKWHGQYTPKWLLCPSQFPPIIKERSEHFVLHGQGQPGEGSHEGVQAWGDACVTGHDSAKERDRIRRVTRGGLRAGVGNDQRRSVLESDAKRMPVEPCTKERRSRDHPSNTNTRTLCSPEVRAAHELPQERNSGEHARAYCRRGRPRLRPHLEHVGQVQ